MKRRRIEVNLGELDQTEIYHDFIPSALSP
jgi:hypothetical protein